QALGFALGAADYLIKPVDKGTLFEKLEELNVVKSKGRKPINILCIDDNQDVLQLLQEILKPADYNVLTAETGREGIEKALTYRPDLIILDLMIPDIDGFALSKALKNNAATLNIPIIILTAKDISVEDRLRLVGRIESLMQKSCFTKEDLLAHIRDLEITYPVRAGLLDQVSGLFDRSYFQIRLAQEICRADRYQTVFSILMADIDRFREYSRIGGIHHVNVCIRKIADFLRKTTRGSDTLVRFGIDEFAIILSSTTEDASRNVARRLLSFIESTPFPEVERLNDKKLTASVAIVDYECLRPSAPETMISKAQELIREIKKYGGGGEHKYLWTYRKRSRKY
ncbi:MAG: diguanylate cyclase, partial [Syntrophaceae bacterium]|nr:diguanylate cyclase [Syntrophaceae bacterium]